ncbi:MULTISPECIES: TetR/AcrR family transcriptional regulator [Mycobacterium]|uniref:Transcriptional regulator, TetR family n=1 Tax=Mycobacterium parascrofulaceum ATCC BAA-614 TaxID=525368 RepID=D5PEH4_9MYCO|nr:MULTISPECIES: TetR/AcrR family transcriptional regulator [Mycobacterium]AGP62369.1 TetR family transcriptional regulator [Mycobacterium intracellulare subsp. yongonense 05-1390]ARR76505.1 transcriptional regulator, TetR family [Mycobacterium intracellulare subsp. yongonense]ARR81652.1 TetR family transcriptional regulator [Mycobacterium intracellulare subsp. yongonense]ASQ84977.1 TetR family transcriptional regulator [Mycobacterium intracellulare subsp. chimaera]ASW99299.1 TetR/AcrR family 
MVSPQTRSRFRFITRSPAQTRILDAALQLIGEHGVGGTSLQMIADAIGVTKAAVYHQFKTKEQIIIALTERELGGLEEALEAAEADHHRSRAREVLLDRVIDVAVERRGAASTLQFDPVIVRLLAEHEPFQHFIQRLYRVLLDNAAEDARVSAAMLSGAIAVGVLHPLVADVSDGNLRSQLRRTIRRLIATESDDTA